MIVDFPQLFGPTRMLIRWSETEKDRSALYLSNLTEEIFTSWGCLLANSEPQRYGLIDFLVTSSVSYCVEHSRGLPRTLREHYQQSASLPTRSSSRVSLPPSRYPPRVRRFHHWGISRRLSSTSLRHEQLLTSVSGPMFGRAGAHPDSRLEGQFEAERGREEEVGHCCPHPSSRH